MSTVTQKLGGLGSFDIRLKPTVPRSLLDRFDFHGHIIVTAAQVDVDELEASDLLFPSLSLYPGVDVYTVRSAIYDAATYAGVIRRLPRGDEFIVGGVGMVFWLGDGEKGPVLEDEVNLGAADIRESVRAVLPKSVTLGTVYDVAGTYTGRHRWQTSREALDYIVESFGAEYRVNPDATVDVGTETHLYATSSLLYPNGDTSGGTGWAASWPSVWWETSNALYPSPSLYPQTIAPSAIAVRDGAEDIDLSTLLASRLQHDADVEDLSTRVLVMAEGEGEQVAVGEADITADVDPGYTDFHGNPVEFTRMVFESETSSGNADSRARLQLNRFTKTRRQITVSTANFRIDGDATPGRHLWIYDPDAGLFDPDNEISFGGNPVWPIAVRVMGATWPVTGDMGVYWRDARGQIVDISEHVQSGSGDTTLEVGASRRTLLTLDATREALRARLNRGAA